MPEQKQDRQATPVDEEAVKEEAKRRFPLNQKIFIAGAHFVLGKQATPVDGKVFNLIESLCENLALQLEMRGCCGHGDGKDRKGDADSYGGMELLSQAKAFLSKAPPTPVKEDEKNFDDVWPKIWDSCMSAGMKLKAGTGLENVISFLEQHKSTDDNAPQAATPSTDSNAKAFDGYVKNARDEFTLFINAFEWRTDLRTHIESLLICFDQMRERLTPSTDSKEDEKKVDDFKQVLKRYVTSFYFWWHNARGNNTYQGYDQWEKDNERTIEMLLHVAATPSTDSNEAIEALKELVRLKDIKDEMDEVPKENEDQAFVIRYGEYVVDKAKAWKKAKEIIKLFSLNKELKADSKEAIEALEFFLKVINRSDTAMGYYGEAIIKAEKAIANYKLFSSNEAKEMKL